MKKLFVLFMATILLLAVGCGDGNKGNGSNSRNAPASSANQKKSAILNHKSNSSIVERFNETLKESFAETGAGGYENFRIPQQLTSKANAEIDSNNEVWYSGEGSHPGVIYRINSPSPQKLKGYERTWRNFSIQFTSLTVSEEQCLALIRNTIKIKDKDCEKVLKNLDAAKGNSQLFGSGQTLYWEDPKTSTIYEYIERGPVAIFTVKMSKQPCSKEEHDGIF